MRYLTVLLLFALTLNGQNKEVEKEAALGARLAEQFRQGSTSFDNAEALSYIGELAVRLVGAAAADFHFGICIDSLEEPIAFPGGYIFVSTGQFLAARNEADFARTLAHAMAHITNRDSVRVATQSQGVTYGSIPLIFLGGWSGAGAKGVAVPLKFREMQQRFEREADDTATRTMANYREETPGEFQRIQLQVRRALPLRNVPTLRRVSP